MYYRNILAVIISYIKIKFGYKPSEEDIPKGMYCYKMVSSEPYQTEPCKYYETLGKGWNGCKFLGVITDDFVFGDQCKICDIKKPN